MEKTRAIVISLISWFSENSRDLPWRRTRDPYGIWVSEIMLQQTQVKTVIPYWERWMRELPTIASLAHASSEKIHKLWEGLGYYTRVRNMQRAAQVIIGKHGGVFPQRFDEVLALPGIGPYTAGAVCSIAYNQPTPILDGNVIRVLTRVFAIGENPKDKETNKKLWSIAGELVEKSKHQTEHTALPCSHFNQSLMELGALVCTPRQPKCLLCPLRKECVAHLENRAEQFPNLGERVAATARRFIAFIVEDREKFLVRQRPADVVNAHLWEFPNIEIPTDRAGLPNIMEPFQIVGDATPFCQIKHSITRYRISLEAFPARLTKNSKPEQVDGVWIPLSELHELAFTSAHKKILGKISAAEKKKVVVDIISSKPANETKRRRHSARIARP